MESKYMKMSDEEALVIITRLQAAIYESEDQLDKDINLIEQSFPEITGLIFHDKRDLTPEQILAEAKEMNKPILL